MPFPRDATNLGRERSLLTSKVQQLQIAVGIKSAREICLERDGLSFVGHVLRSIANKIIERGFSPSKKYDKNDVVESGPDGEGCDSHEG